MFCSKLILLFFIGNSLLLMPVCLAQSQPNEKSNEESLRIFLKDFLKIPATDDGGSVSCRFSFVDLNDDGKKEAIVYIMDKAWCGSGGCTTLVLAPRNASYAIITKIALTRPPIRVLGTKSKGWLDLSVVVGGGGTESAHDVRLSFDGKTYPRNPTMPPAQPVSGRIEGRIVVAK